VEYGMFTNTFVVSGSDVYIDNPMWNNILKNWVPHIEDWVEKDGNLSIYENHMVYRWSNDGGSTYSLYYVDLDTPETTLNLWNAADMSNFYILNRQNKLYIAYVKNSTQSLYIKWINQTGEWLLVANNFINNYDTDNFLRNTIDDMSFDEAWNTLYYMQDGVLMGQVLDLQ
jgi:hypothetical protein